MACLFCAKLLIEPQWTSMKFNQSETILFQENAFEDVICKSVSILSMATELKLLSARRASEIFHCE